MTIDSTIAVLSTSVALITTVVLFIIDGRRRDRQAIVAVRSQSVLDAITRMDAVAVGMRKFAWQRLGQSVEVEFIVASFRLVAALDKKDRPVGMWVGTEAARLQLAASDDEAFRRGVDLVAKLVEWHVGTRPTSWFESRLPDLALPTSAEKQAANRRRLFSRTRRLMVEGGAAVVVASALRSIWAQTSPAELSSLIRGGRLRR